MIAYDGNNPFAFVSYSHLDKEYVFEIIKLLKIKMCRIWYDEGLHAGESWNKEIADKLKNCSSLIVFLTPNSVLSKYVFMEINYAIRNDKKIIPILLNQTTLTNELEMMLSVTQFINVSNEDDLEITCNEIFKFLPKSIISFVEQPFLQDLGYSFYIRVNRLEREETGTKNACSIVSVNEQEEIELFSLKRLGAYDVAYSLSAVEPIKDFFYSGKIIGSYQVNLKGSFYLEYPLYGPDVDVLLVCILRIPRHSPPTIKLVDYQYIESVSSLNLKDEEDLNVVGKKGWSMQIEKYLEGLLYK